MVENFKNKKVTIMGLGLNGGGLASAIFFAKEGAEVTVTDLRTREILSPTIEKLKDFSINYTLGEHLDDDFINADIVIKNPGVRRDSKYLKLAKRVETDISIFLSRVNSPIIAVTGSKGKSSTVSAIYSVLKDVYPDARLGGNITVSPLTFISDISEKTPVVLELSSWQLADIKSKKCLNPQICAITNIMNDHQNAYNSIYEYADDKAVIFENFPKDTILNYDDEFTKYFEKSLKNKPLYFSKTELPANIDGAFLSGNREGYIRINNITEKILPKELSIMGEHQRINLLLAGLILYRFGISSEIIKTGLSKFPGIPYRMELVKEKNSIKYYNDSAATIPEAVIAAINSFNTPLILITGGTDKELEFESVKDDFKKPRLIYLLKGTGTDKLIKVLDREKINYYGPYNSLEELIEILKKDLTPGDSVLFSPGATSFGMFNNEFHRGDQFKKIISSI